MVILCLRLRLLPVPRSQILLPERIRICVHTAVQRRPFRIFLEQTHSFDVVVLVGREAVVGACWHDPVHSIYISLTVFLPCSARIVPCTFQGPSAAPLTSNHPSPALSSPTHPPYS